MRNRSTALPLALVFVALVLYASLYPFEGWRWPAGLDLIDVLHLPWPPWRDRFDEAANFAGYVPLGALLFGAVVRGGGRAAPAFALAIVAPLLLSYGVEVAQTFVPQRVPSLKDCAFNVAGACAGALLAAGLQALGLLERWHRLRGRWFARDDSAVALGLLLLWPVALLFPAPVPLGLGAIWSELGDLLQAVLAGTPWADLAAAWMGQAQAVQVPLTPARESAIVALGLLAPVWLAYGTSRAGWHRLAMAPGAALLALATMTLSTALNFGPTHALAWWSPSTGFALAAATVLGVLLSALGARFAAALGLMALAALVTLVAQAPADPYYAASLQGWETGRFIRFHGLARWIGWCWPYAAMAWLLARVSRRGDL